MNLPGWTLLLVIAAILFFSRRYQEDDVMRRSPNDPWSGGVVPSQAIRSKRDIFSVKVIALEFDENGPSIYINGEFQNSDERAPIDFATARISSGGRDEVFISFDPDSGETGCVGCRESTLITFIAPVTLHPGERGLFRTPLFCEERKEKINNMLEGLEHAAKQQVEVFDRELGGYSLDGPEYEKLEERFLNSPKVASIGRLLDDELFWRQGPISISAHWLDHGEDEEESIVDAINVDELEVTINLDEETASVLSENVIVLLRNALRGEFELDPLPYQSVTLDL